MEFHMQLPRGTTYCDESLVYSFEFPFVELINLYEMAAEWAEKIYHGWKIYTLAPGSQPKFTAEYDPYIVISL
jgi:hypothetical protein